MLTRPSRDVRIGILGMGDIGAVTAERLPMFDFQVFGWSRTRKDVPGVNSFAGQEELPQFLAHCDIMVCMLPLTPETESILNAKLFAGLPKGAWVINVGRGGHCKEEDLIAALDSDHLAGAVLDVFQTEPLPADNPAVDPSQGDGDAAYRRHHRSAQRRAPLWWTASRAPKAARPSGMSWT